jgi:hypothetical protein
MRPRLATVSIATRRLALSRSGQDQISSSSFAAAMVGLAPGRQPMENASARMGRGQDQFAIMFDERFGAA